MRLPPAIAPRQIVVVPMLRDKPEDADVLAYCENLVKALSGMTAFGQPLRALLDTKKIKSAEKRWNWVRRGAPIIVEVGPRDAASGNVTFMRRDQLREGDKIRSFVLPRDEFLAKVPALLAEIQQALYDEAKIRLEANIRTDIRTFDALAEYFGAAASDDEDEAEGVATFKGWVRAPWARPTGEELEAVEARLKTLKLTLRNVPLGQGPASGTCLFTGRPAVEEIIISRSY